MREAGYRDGQLLSRTADERLQGGTESSKLESSEPFEPRRYERVAVKVVDVYGNESTVGKALNGK